MAFDGTKSGKVCIVGAGCSGFTMQVDFNTGVRDLMKEIEKGKKRATVNA